MRSWGDFHPLYAALPLDTSLSALRKGLMLLLSMAW